MEYFIFADKNKLKLHVFCNDIDRFFFPCLVLGLNMLGQFQMQKTVFVEQHKKKLLRVFNFETSTCHVNILYCFRGHRTGITEGVFLCLQVCGCGWIQDGSIFSADWLWAVAGVWLVSE